jgi:hypothetical protein
MHDPHAAFFEFRQVTKSLADLSDAQAILTLKFELIHALERAHDQQSRSRSLQAEVDRLQSEIGARSQEHQAFAADLNRRLTLKDRELRAARVDSEQLRAMRLEILSMETQCQTLDDICRSLLLTIEHAAGAPDIAQTAPTEPCALARVSA